MLIPFNRKHTIGTRLIKRFSRKQGCKFQLRISKMLWRWFQKQSKEFSSLSDTKQTNTFSRESKNEQTALREKTFKIMHHRAICRFSSNIRINSNPCSSICSFSSSSRTSILSKEVRWMSFQQRLMLEGSIMLESYRRILRRMELSICYKKRIRQ